ncbi:Histidine kinase-like ATPase, C-terminal domain containing protein [Amanita muscaria]
MASASVPGPASIKAIDKTSIHRISSGQVIVDLQTAVKELVENSLDAGATSIEVRFKHWGLTSVEVIDNGCGIAEKDWESVGLKHYTSKLSTFDDLSVIHTFGFRGEAISSLCALCDNVVVTTATDGPMGIQLDLEQSGKVGKKTKVARQRGTTVMFTRLFASLPVRRKELQRNIKREFGKALGLLNAYALGPCAGMDSSGGGVRLSVINQTENGQKVPQIKTEGVSSFKSSVAALWGPKAMDNTVELALDFRVQREKSVARRINDKYSQDSQSQSEDDAVSVQVKGLISKFTVGCGRTGTDRQFFYVNGRPCNLTKVQKAFNEVYRSFNANQSPFILADFIIPTEFCDINVSPDKRTIFMQSEQNLVDALKVCVTNLCQNTSLTLMSFRMR